MAEQSSTYDGFISYSHAADGLLAPRLQSALQRFAKPWWKRRAVRIFRDESSLSANPHLWSSITDALETSGWFILLLSPDAAHSEWVNQEIAYWTTHRDPSRILPVVTDGSFGWTHGDITGDAVPDTLRGVFTEEPRWVDLRWARDEDQLDLQDPRFADAVADIASTIRGIPKDDLASEEVKQHRQTVRNAWTAGALVTVLAITAVGFGLSSARNADEAERQTARAEQQARLAEENAQAETEARARADESARLADSEAETARQAGALASARALGSASVAALSEENDPQLAALLALESIRIAGSASNETKAVVDTLYRALVADRQVGSIDTGHDGYAWISLSSDGRRLAVSSELGASVQMYSVPKAELLWEFIDEDTSDWYYELRFDPSGERVIVWVTDSDGSKRGLAADDQPPRLVVFDAGSGEILETLAYRDCQDVGLIGTGWSPDGRWLALTNGFRPCPRDRAPEGLWVEILDGTTYESVAVIEVEDPLATWTVFAADELFLSAFLGGTTVYSVPEFEPVREIPGQLGPTAVSPDGSLLYSVDFADPRNHALLDAVTGERRDGFTTRSYPALNSGFTFSPDGSRFVIQTEGSFTHVFDVASGDELFRLRTGRGGNPQMSRDNSLLYTSHTDGTVKIWDLSSRSLATETLGSFGEFDFVNGNHITLGPSLGAIEVIDWDRIGANSTGSGGDDWPEAQIVFFDRATGELVGDPIPGSEAQALADGRFVISFWTDAQPDRYQPSRGSYVYDPETGASDVLIGCVDIDPRSCDESATPTWLRVSIDGTEILARDDGMPVWRVLAPDGRQLGTIETDQRWSWVSAFDDQWVIGYSEFEVSYTAMDRQTGDLLFSLSVCGCREEVSQSGGFLVAADGGELTFVELGTWETTRVATKAGHVRGMAFDDAEERLAIADEDTLWIVDVQAQAVDQSFPMSGVSDIHWVDEETLVLGTDDGRWLRVSLSVDDLVARLIDDPPRGFTEAECADHAIQDCPTSREAVRDRYEELARP